jgi:hypothetical protein
VALVATGGLILPALTGCSKRRCCAVRRPGSPTSRHRFAVARSLGECLGTAEQVFGT